MNDDLLAGHVEENPMISSPETIVAIVVGEPFNVAMQAVLEAGNLANNLVGNARRNPF